MPSSGYPGYRPIYMEGLSSNSPVHVMEVRPIKQWSGWIPNKLKSNLHLRFPLFALMGRVLRQVQQDQSSMILITPAWELQSRFPGLLRVSVRTALLLPETDIYKDPAGELPSTDSAKFSKTSSMDYLRKNLQAEGVSKRASDLITNPRCTSSLSHYKSVWGKWLSW